MTTPRFSLPFAVFALVLMACGDDNPRQGFEWGDGCAFDDEMQVCIQTASGVVGIGDDGSVPWVTGGQGGSMIRPVVVLPAGVTPSRTDGLYITLVHTPDPEYPEDFESDVEMGNGRLIGDVNEVEGRWVVGPVDDFLSYGSLDGVRMILTARVEDVPGEVAIAVVLR